MINKIISTCLIKFCLTSFFFFIIYVSPRREKRGKNGIMKNKKGFSLLELLVVVLIIGILAAIALSQYRKIVIKSRATVGFEMIRSLAESNERYYMVHNQYTRHFSDLDVDVSLGWEYRENATWDSYCNPSCDNPKEYIDMSANNTTFGLQIGDVSFEILYYFNLKSGQKFKCFYGNTPIDFYTDICHNLGFNRKSGKMWLYGN